MNNSAAHSRLKAEIKLAIGALPDVRIFDNPRGQAKNPETGAVLIFGLAPGASDLIGIGPRGRFMALEVKTGAAVPTPQQRAFLEAIARQGGIAGVVRSVNDALCLISEAR